jgi:hypothetical protein
VFHSSGRLISPFFCGIPVPGISLQVHQYSPSACEIFFKLKFSESKDTILGRFGFAAKSGEPIQTKQKPPPGKSIVEEAFGDSLVSFGRSIVEKMHSISRLWRFISNQSNGWSTLGYSPEHTNLLSVSIERYLKARIRFRDNMALFTYLVFMGKSVYGPVF